MQVPEQQVQVQAVRDQPGQEQREQEQEPPALPRRECQPGKLPGPGKPAPQLQRQPPAGLPRVAGPGHQRAPIQAPPWCSGARPVGPPGRCAGPWRPPRLLPGPHWPAPPGSWRFRPCAPHHQPPWWRPPPRQSATLMTGRLRRRPRRYGSGWRKWPGGWQPAEGFHRSRSRRCPGRDSARRCGRGPPQVVPPVSWFCPAARGQLQLSLRQLPPLMSAAPAPPLPRCKRCWPAWRQRRRPAGRLPQPPGCAQCSPPGPLWPLHWLSQRQCPPGKAIQERQERQWRGTAARKPPQPALPVL